MPNNYFQFKQFTIYQDHCAMKVTTDGCLFGAYVAGLIQNSKVKSKNWLDIGTGTGLLSLMLAQKNDLLLDAVEIDEPTYLQAKSNFEQSPWKEKLSIFNTDILQFDTAKKYDCIITNPPFFEDDLKSDQLTKNQAKHDASLTLLQLLKAIDTHLSTDGNFFVLLPFHRSDYFEKEAAVLNFHLVEKLIVKQTPAHNYFRSVLYFSRNEALPRITELTIKNTEGNYTAAFNALLKDYYLFIKD